MLRSNILYVDLLAVAIVVNGHRVELRLREFRLLAYLAHAGRPVPSEELYREVFRLRFRPETNALAVHLSRLRARLPDTHAIRRTSTGYELTGPVEMVPALAAG